jgi:hypothetical protein
VSDAKLFAGLPNEDAKQMLEVEEIHTRINMEDGISLSSIAEDVQPSIYPSESNARYKIYQIPLLKGATGVFV